MIFISNVYFYIKTQPQLKNAFKDYLDNLESIEQVDNFEVNVYSLNELIDAIFSNMDEINKLFEYKFGCNLFSPPLRSQSMLNKATREKEINLTELVATIGAIIDGICNKEIDALLTSKQIIGSINKIKTLLD